MIALLLAFAAIGADCPTVDHRTVSHTIIAEQGGYRDDRVVLPIPGQYGKPVKGDRGPRGADGATGAQGPAGPQGASGKPGRDGRDGVDGKDGKDGQSPDMAALVEQLTQEITAAVLAKIPPTKFRIIGVNGQVVKEVSVPAGGALDLLPIYFEQYDVDGKKIDGETIPQGGTLRIQQLVTPIKVK